ncbi:ferric uptake regulator, Fur family [Alkalidesulfovibrio alkalitolerans DSM 16529]|jgi:Fur family ferric uptake transcriptional regulator|uniref:Ferric uptake regulation protein n=1 Tax=Alkalidesulfovibrio alkalitolerans DSM 16529 TaxID=1121439 RepID=S7UKE7_9BACT|nr:transcriptional repressor [Alkalidesulfovibrio alkalitolerans]EPR32758.1 ferric uptake regulator, Fur family [Alkalidesulfovibrio alkalitolerans DSM 16529]
MRNRLDAFIAYLAANGLKLTAQRRLILTEIEEARRCLSPEEVFVRVRSRDARVSMATVYRTLKLLAEAGLVREMSYRDSPRRYVLPENATDHAARHVCPSCGRLEPST